MYVSPAVDGPLFSAATELAKRSLETVYTLLNNSINILNILCVFYAWIFATSLSDITVLNL